MRNVTIKVSRDSSHNEVINALLSELGLTYRMIENSPQDITITDVHWLRNADQGNAFLPHYSKCDECDRSCEVGTTVCEPCDSKTNIFH